MPSSLGRAGSEGLPRAPEGGLGVGHFEETAGVLGAGRVGVAAGGRGERHRVEGRGRSRGRPGVLRRGGGGRRDADGEGARPVVELDEPVPQVGHELGAQLDVHAGGGGEALGHLGGARRVARPEAVRLGQGAGRQAPLLLQFVQVLDRQLQDVSLLQFADVLPFGLEGAHHELLELVQAPVDAGSSLPLQHRFHDLRKRKKREISLNVG
ncbi:hypothetical protein AAG570_002503 [Ranatra chinensis]|uniref:Uncharacterized protein n=1 Tax=Ranatra chinensis TaxID=642074 RepID=A0ABD0Y7R1_9HEMI